jgi:uncharacterized protein with beta-barrel porin domain
LAISAFARRISSRKNSTGNSNWRHSRLECISAPLPHDSAITSAGAQYFLSPNWSLIASFTGNFAAGYQTYAGTGTLRYTW